MFLVDEAAEAAVRNGFESGGLAGAAEALRLRFRGLDLGTAAKCAEQILSWHPVPPESKPPEKKGFMVDEFNHALEGVESMAD